jgi:bifunctional DNA-binding transcriptional regulator/antitoxin component of YhaV-PrlF toxin-antitoxin module
MSSLSMTPGGEIAIPQPLRERYGMKPGVPIRVVETRSGILLVPLTDAPMADELAKELAEWQALSLTT